MSSTTYSLFLRWTAKRGYASDRAALADLGVSHGAAQHWKAGKNAGADVIERMALDLGENPGTLIASAMAEQARGDAAKTWARLAKKLAGVGLALAGLSLLPAYPTNSKPLTSKLDNDAGYALCEVACSVFSCAGRLLCGFECRPRNRAR